MKQNQRQEGSFIMLDRYFETGDGRFLNELRSIHSVHKSAQIADRWKHDNRPWAREQIFAYLEFPMDALEHQPIVKRMLKHAEQSRDDELMGAFLAAFDRLVRRVRKQRWTWDQQARRSYMQAHLSLPRNSLPLRASLKRTTLNPRTGRKMTYKVKIKPGILFSYHTRYYLRRRAWRYFRRAGFQRPDQYPAIIAGALMRYQDKDLSAGEHIMECWGLMQACFREHPGLRFTASRIHINHNFKLKDLTPAPRFPELWQRAESLLILCDLAVGAGSRLIRIWALDLLKQYHHAGFSSIEPERIIVFLSHRDEDIHCFGLELIKINQQVALASLDFWFNLLKKCHPNVLDGVCQAMQRHVSPDRMSLEQCIELACAPSAPVARLGLALLQQTPLTSAEDREKLVKLADAECSVLGAELAEFALSWILPAEYYDPNLLIHFFDSPQSAVRLKAFSLLTPEVPAYHDPCLFSWLTETPYEDVKLRLINSLAQRSVLPGSDPESLSPLWCAVLLGVHRGGRQKLKAVNQLTEAIIQSPELSQQFLPVLTAVLRSSREPEKQAGLKALVRIATERPELISRIERTAPELSLQ